VGIGLSFISPWLGMLIYTSVAIIWFIPDTRIEKRITADKRSEKET